MPVDTSSYGLASQVPSPFDTLSKLTGIQNTANQNKLFQQEYNSKLGLAQIYKQAIDPATGQLDTQKLHQLMADPNASQNVTMGLAQAYQNSQEAQQRNIGINSSQLDLVQKHIGALNNFISPLLAKKDLNSKDVAASLGDAVNAGLASWGQASQLYSTIPTLGGKPLSEGGEVDESQVRPWLQQHQMQLMDSAARFNMTNPSPTMQQLPGGGMAPFVMPQIGQVSQVGPTIGAAAPPTTQTYDANGQARYVGPTNANNPYAPNGQPIDPNATPQQPQQQSALTGSMPGLAPAGNQPPNASSAQGNGNIAGALAAPPPGVVDAAQVQAHASAQQGVALQQRSDAVPQTKALLGNLESEIDNFTPGPGANWSKTAGAFVNRLSQAVGLPGIDPKSISSQEQFNKQAAMIAQTQFQSLGGTGTDKQLGSTELTSPSSELSKLGNKGIISMLKGNEDAIATKNREWQQYQQANGPQSYGQFSTQFNKEYDPRVFQSVYLAPQDRSKMIAGMSKSEKDQFKQSYNLAVQKGWIPDPRQPNASQ